MWKRRTARLSVKAGHKNKVRRCSTEGRPLSMGSAQLPQHENCCPPLSFPVTGPRKTRQLANHLGNYADYLRIADYIDFLKFR